MIPAGFAGIEDQLWLWLVAMIRPGAAFLAAPIFGAAFVPLQVRAIVALAIGIPGLAFTSFHLPPEGLATMAGFLLVAGEIIAGLAIGFAVQIGFSCALVSGEVIGNAMGLGFAAMMDPATGQQNPVLGQFLMIVATLLFLAMDGHLMLARVIVESYHALPPGKGMILVELPLSFKPPERNLKGHNLVHDPREEFAGLGNGPGNRHVPLINMYRLPKNV